MDSGSTLSNEPAADETASEASPATPGTAATLEPIDLGGYSCPRCSLNTASEFYGPCDACVAELRVKMAGEGGDVEVAEYEPKMNVTPNAVALKE